MPRFIQQTNAKKGKQKIFNKIMFVLVLLFILVSLFDYNWNDRFTFSPNIFLGSYLLWSAFDSWRAGKRVYSLEITDLYIGWLETDKITNRILIDWNDIRWIKKEKDGGITFFRDSSFSEHFPLADFSEYDRNEIMLLLYQQANTRQIRLINFSEPVSAVA